MTKLFLDFDKEIKVMETDKDDDNDLSISNQNMI